MSNEGGSNCDYVFLVYGKEYSIDFLNSWTNTLTYMHNNQIDFGYAFGYDYNIDHSKNGLITTPLMDLSTAISSVDIIEPYSLFSNLVNPKRVIFIDSAISWTTDDLEALLYAKEDILCGAHLIDKEGRLSVVEVEKDDYMMLDEIFTKFESFEIDVASSKFFSCNSEVLKTLTYPWFISSYRPSVEEEKWIFVNEDMYFFTKAKEEGYKIFCNPYINISHSRYQISSIRQ